MCTRLPAPNALRCDLWCARDTTLSLAALQLWPVDNNVMVWRLEVVKFDADTAAGRKLKCVARLALPCLPPMPGLPLPAHASWSSCPLLACSDDLQTLGSKHGSKYAAVELELRCELCLTHA